MATSAPHSGAGAWAPSPRKLRPAAQRMDVANWRVDCTTIGDSVLGRTWNARIRRWLWPIARAASRKGSAMSASTCPRTSRVYVGNRHDADRDHHVLEPGAHDGDDHDGEQHARKGEEHVDQALGEEVERPADVAGEEPEGHADQETDGDGDEADTEREAGAPDDPGQHVPSELVGPEPVLAGRIFRAPARGRPGRDRGAPATAPGGPPARRAARARRPPVRSGGGRRVRRTSSTGSCPSYPGRIRGSTRLYTRSTTRFVRTNPQAATRTTPWMTG